MSIAAICDMCGRAIAPHTHYLVRVDVMADPGTPALDANSGAGGVGGADELAAVIEQLNDLTADELQDQVFRRFEYTVCGSCQREVLANPLGKPRRVGVSEN